MRNRVPGAEQHPGEVTNNKRSQTFQQASPLQVAAETRFGDLPPAYRTKNEGLTQPPELRSDMEATPCHVVHDVQVDFRAELSCNSQYLSLPPDALDDGAQGPQSQ